MLLPEKYCRLLIISALLCTLTPAHSQSSIWSGKSEQTVSADQALSAYESGYRNYRSGNFNKAEDDFIEALRLEPNLIKSHYWLGKLYNEQGRLEDAIFHWEEVERLVKLIRERRAALKIENNEYPSYSQMLKVSQSTREAREFYEKGMHLLDKGHWDGAEVEMRKAVELYPGNHQYTLQLARILWDKGEKQASVKFYRDLLSKRDVDFTSFKEGIEKMIGAEMPYVAAPLVKELEARFAHHPEFSTIKQKFTEETQHKIFADGKVIKRVDGQVIINLGMAEGLNLSDEYSLRIKSFNPGAPLLDLDTGKTLGRSPDRTSAELLLTKVYQHTSWALIKREYGPGVKAGDLIEFKKTNR